MSLYRLIAFLEVSADARESPNSVEEPQLNNRFDYINRHSSSKEDNYSITPFGPSFSSTKLGV